MNICPNVSLGQCLMLLKASLVVVKRTFVVKLTADPVSSSISKSFLLITNRNLSNCDAVHGCCSVDTLLMWCLL